jgi:hypothetical protein
LPLELQDHVPQLKDMYKQHVEFAKQSKQAEKTRSKEDDGQSAGQQPLKHNPRDGPAPAKELSLEEKLAKRRADELKWLEEYSEKEKKRQGDLSDQKEVIDRAEWEKKEEERINQEKLKRQQEEDARKNAAMSHINELKSENSPHNNQFVEVSSAAQIVEKIGSDKKRKDKQKKEKKKERTGQFDDIRKLAASASLMTSFE